MRTRYLLVSALLLMLMVLPSCNQNLSPDRSASSLFITLPDNSKVRVDNAKYYKDMPDMQNCSCVLASVNDEKQYLYLSLSLIFDKDHLVVGQEMDFERFSFSIPISSDSHDYTHTYSGHIYLDELTRSGIILRMENVSVTIGKGTYQMNGQLVCR